MLLFLSACAEHKALLSDQEYLDLGQKHLADRDYNEARQAFEDLEAKHPDSQLLAQARLINAQSYFDQGKYAEASLQYQRFLRYHPRNPLADKAQFQLALSYFNQRLSIDRETTDTLRALQEFERLLQDYSASFYALQAEEKKNLCLEELAEHEFYIGYFYFKQKKYAAAQARLRKTLTEFPQGQAAPKSLYYLAESYWQLDMRPQARQLFKLYLERYAEKEYAAEAEQRLYFQ